MPAILSSKENVSRCAAWCDHDARVQKNIPEAKLAVTRFGEDLSRAMDFSAAYVGDGGSLAAYMHRSMAMQEVPRGLLGVSSSSRWQETRQVQVRNRGPEERERSRNRPEVL